jgi:carbon starvation protein
MLAAIALCLATTIILKMQLRPRLAQCPDCLIAQDPDPRQLGRPAFALLTLVPLVWLLAATMTAGLQKICHADPRIGFLAQARLLGQKAPPIARALADAQATRDPAAIQAAEQALRANRVLRFNNRLDAAVAAFFLLLVSAIVLLCVREWILLCARRKPVLLRETNPVWLPQYASAEVKSGRLWGFLTLGFALARELSGEAHFERARLAAHSSLPGQSPGACPDANSSRELAKSQRLLFVKATEERFKGVRRCC